MRSLLGHSPLGMLALHFCLIAAYVGHNHARSSARLGPVDWSHNLEAVPGFEVLPMNTCDDKQRKDHVTRKWNIEQLLRYALPGRQIAHLLLHGVRIMTACARMHPAQ